MDCLLPSSERFLKYDILQKFAENFDIPLESLKSELNFLPRTIQQYELKNNIKINNLIQLTEMISIYKLAVIEFYKLRVAFVLQCQLAAVHAREHSLVCVG